MNDIRIVIADDHHILLDGLVALFEKQKDIFLAGAYDNGQTLFDELAEKKPDIALIDINMPDLNGHELTLKMAKSYPSIKVIALSMFDDVHHINQLVNAGVSAYLFKNVSNAELLEAIHAVARGKMFFSAEIESKIADFEDANRKKKDEPGIPTLSRRELEIIKLIASEHTNAQIADALFISERTVETHRKNMLRKTNHKNMVGLLKYVMDNHMI